MNTDGTGYSTLHNFHGSDNDGAYPQDGTQLTLSGSTLYGMTLTAATATVVRHDLPRQHRLAAIYASAPLSVFGPQLWPVPRGAH
jgi:hypothetical protein